MFSQNHPILREHCLLKQHMQIIWNVRLLERERRSIHIITCMKWKQFFHKTWLYGSWPPYMTHSLVSVMWIGSCSQWINSHTWGDWKSRAYRCGLQTKRPRSVIDEINCRAWMGLLCFIGWTQWALDRRKVWLNWSSWLQDFIRERHNNFQSCCPNQLLKWSFQMPGVDRSIIYDAENVFPHTKEFGKFVALWSILCFGSRNFGDCEVRFPSPG